MSLFNKKNNKEFARVCLRVSEEGTSIAVSEHNGDKLQLHLCEFFSALALAEKPALITDFIAEHHLASAHCSLILAASEYQLLLTEAPEVASHEMCDALWWKVKDLVAFDIENAQIDYLDLPEDNAKHQARKIYAVIADKSKVKAKVIWAQKLGLTPTTVEIPETALLHLVADLCSDLVGTSILYLNAEQSMLMLMSERKMYLSRTLQYNYQDRMEAVVLDIQRSMDYYESQIGKPPCLKVIVLPLQSDESSMMQTLLTNMGVEITTVNINDLIDSDMNISIEMQQHCLLAISGALRSDKKAKR
ncbi:MAG: MSHA biogenesis protein MshI [Oceanospirillaceae bacterium]